METRKNIHLLGQPKSGRFWKNQKSRFRTLKKSPGLKSTYEEKQKFKEELKRIKSLSKELVERRNAVKRVQKQTRKENIRRRKENETKAEILQVVKNPAKLKRLKKKELKRIRKRDAVNTER